TPPHFWALALYRNEDYRLAGVPMLPVVRGKAETRRHIVVYTIVLVLSGVTPSVFGFVGPLYMGVSTVLGLWFLVQSLRVAREQDTKTEPQARRLFGVSILYLFALFAALILERIMGIGPLTSLAG